MMMEIAMGSKPKNIILAKKKSAMTQPLEASVLRTKIKNGAAQIKAILPLVKGRMPTPTSGASA